MRDVQNDRQTSPILAWGLMWALAACCLLATLGAWRQDEWLYALGVALALMALGGLVMWAVFALTRSAATRTMEAEHRLAALLVGIKADADAADARRDAARKENLAHAMTAIDAVRSELLKDLSSHAASVHQDIAGLSRIAMDNERHIKCLGTDLDSLGESVHDRLVQLHDASAGLVKSIATTFDAANSRFSQSSSRALNALLDETRSVERRIVDRIAEEASLVKDVAQSTLVRLEDANAIGDRIETLRTELSHGLKKSQSDVARQIESIESIERAFAQLGDDAWLKDVAARALTGMQREALQEVEAMIQLHRMSALAMAAPLLGGWALDPVAMLAIVKLIGRSRPRVVLECGSGTSTIWIGAALRSIGEGHLTTLEHLAAYAEETRTEVSLHGLESWVNVRFAELTQIQVGESTYNWYSPAALHDISGIELLLVDGPPKASGPAARYPAIPLLAEKLSDRALIVLDDTDRPTENKILKRWLAELPGLEVVGNLGPRTKLLKFSRVV